MRRPYCLLFALLLALLPVVAGCDSSSSGPDALPSEVAGTYSFAQYTFTPSASGVDVQDVRQRLDSLDTRLNLFEDGRFVMTYRFKGDTTHTRPLYGVFEVTSSAVMLVPSSGLTDSLWQAVIGPRLELLRSRAEPDVLYTLVTRTLDMGLFDPKYRKVTATGVLRMRLER